jgi:hypothetical protein
VSVMAETQQLEAAFAGAEPAYPLTWSGMVAGLIGGAAAAVLCDSLLGGLAIFTVCAAAGLTWRRDEAPVFPFLLAYQWLSVVIGRSYEFGFGPLPERYAPGDLDSAILWSLGGLLLLAAGIRLGGGDARNLGRRTSRLGHPGRARILFWMVLTVYALDYVRAINPKDYGGLEQFIQAGLDCRQILLMALWFEVLAGRGRLGYLVISFLWVFVPALGNYFSTFKGPAMLLLIVAASSWRPWDRNWWHTGAPKIAAFLPVALLVLLLAVVWQGGVKKETRKAFDRDQIGSGVGDRVGFFAERVQETWPALWEDPRDAVEAFVTRMSYVTFFSRVLVHVPYVEPHARGELLRMAVLNAFVPRVLYPDKPALPSDSYYTRRFAAVNVAEGMTSISIGYMAEFYADWGRSGMLISVFGYGLLMGLIRRGLRRVVKPTLFIDGALATVFMPVLAFEHQFVKGFGAINVGFLVVAAVVVISRRWLPRVLVEDVLEPAETPVTPPERAADPAPYSA